MRLLCFGLLLLVGWTTLPVSASAGANSIYWRFDGSQAGQEVTSVDDAAGKLKVVAEGQAPRFIDDVPMAIIPLTTDANHSALQFDRGWLRVPSAPDWSKGEGFTVEMWVKFSAAPSEEVLIARGSVSQGNWHFVRHGDGSVDAAIYGQATCYFFDTASGGPIPGVWYHLAASYGNRDGKTRIRAYVNGQLRDVAVGPQLGGAGETDLFLASFIDGKFPFAGAIDEVRISSGVLQPREFLISGERPIPERAAALAPVFVKPGMRIDAKVREKAKGAPILAKPEGYTYFYKYSTGTPVARGSVPEGYDQGFSGAIQGWQVMNGAAPAGYSIAVKPGGSYLVAVGFYDPSAKTGEKRQKVVIDGRIVDQLDPAGDGKPFLRQYEAMDANNDGFLQVSCSQTGDEVPYCGAMNVIWIFPASQSRNVDLAALLKGTSDVPPAYYIRCGQPEQFKGHVGYPSLSADRKSKMLSMRPVPFDLKPDWPQPPDPMDMTVAGDLADRIWTYLDRWGYCGRDQRLVPGFLSDCGYEVVGRNIETIYMLGRLMGRDFELDKPLEALLAKQDSSSKHPGAFVSGNPLRTGFIWGQGTILSGLMAYHELTGDPKAIESAGKLADWYQDYLDNGDLNAANYFANESEFSREGATVGHLGKGALEPMVWLYWRTKDTKYLDEARKMADLNRQWGGVTWMINGDLPPDRQQYEGWHVHANLTTVRGFPWLYAATGDRSYLDDAVKACDRVSERATWGTGGVLERIPWAGTEFPGATPDPHDETCQTSDELQLSYLLGEFTGENRFYDRAEFIYYNHIRYMQMHSGDFTAFNRLPGPQRGGDAWFCCGWWGAKALYEAARHIYAFSPAAVYVTGYMPSSADLRLKNGTVRVSMQADIPKSGEVSLRIDPRGTQALDLKLRVPGWAILKGVKINGEAITATPVGDWVTLNRKWSRGDEVQVSFELPLRVVLDSSWDNLPAAKVSLDGKPPADARYVLVFRGPVIVAQFRLAHGCDLNWAYTGDHPDLFENLTTCADVIEGRDWAFESSSAPALTSVRKTGDGILLEWQATPQPGWTLKRTALVRAGIPVRIEYTGEITAPSQEEVETLKSFRLCGVRMNHTGFVDYRRPTIIWNGRKTPAGELNDEVKPAGRVVLDNGYVQFDVRSSSNGFAVADGSSVYQVPSRIGRTLKAACTLTIAGQSQFAQPMVGCGDAN